MRKRLLLVVIAFAMHVCSVQAQTLFNAPDTVCVNQPIFLTANTSSDASFYWGFCSGYLPDVPDGSNLGTGFGFDVPNAIEVAKDGNNYYAFVANNATNELFRLNYGSSFSNTPTVTNLTDLLGTMPLATHSLFIYRDADNDWYMFACGGTDATNSTMARIDFGSSLANIPNSVNFGSLGGALDAPRGVFVAEEAGQYYGYVVNAAASTLIRLDFGANVQLTPVPTDLGALGGTLNNPSDIGAVQEGLNWYLFITNYGNNTLTRVTLPGSVAGTPSALNLGTFSNQLFGPSAISVVVDCGRSYAFITDRLTNEITRIDIGTFGAGPYTGENIAGAGADLSAPEDITRIIREGDSLFAYITNAGDNSLSRLAFNQCTESTILSANTEIPPVYEYTAPGTYNVYLAVNEGLPNARLECKPIVVLPVPDLTISNDTFICQGDTIPLVAYGTGSLIDSIRWSPDFNITVTDSIATRVYPDFDITYRPVIYFPNGCIVDTAINVGVGRVKADAGHDRTLPDGAGTTLGGPGTSIGPDYNYLWTPSLFLDGVLDPNPTSTPSYDVTYYLTVYNSTYGCIDVDTVTIRTECGDLNLPNAFSPNTKTTEGSNRFGLLNRQVVKLNYFRIFNRWGEKVFETADPTQKWDGRWNGTDAPFGVYIWEADGFCTSGQRFSKKGNVTLLR